MQVGITPVGWLAVTVPTIGVSKPGATVADAIHVATRNLALNHLLMTWTHAGIRNCSLIRHDLTRYILPIYSKIMNAT